MIFSDRDSRDYYKHIKPDRIQDHALGLGSALTRKVRLCTSELLLKQGSIEDQ